MLQSQTMKCATNPVPNHLGHFRSTTSNRTRRAVRCMAKQGDTPAIMVNSCSGKVVGFWCAIYIA